MPLITKTFFYKGTIQEAVIPPGTLSMDISLWGAGGGGGGSDQGGPGGRGAAGHYITATNIDLTSYAGQTIKVGVGGGGAGGQNHRGGAAGGTNGKSITGYSGGKGGNAGPANASGAGGGGGGATVILIGATEIAIAGGGGAGAGAGIASNGGAGVNSNTATANTPGTLGENGANHTGDGGGGGAGGGGADGGTGGNGGSGDAGGKGGKSGSNLVPAGGTANDGTGQAPGGTSDPGYRVRPGGLGGAISYPTATGGNPASSGGNGLAVITFNISVQAKHKVSGTWKDTSNLYYKVSGTWKQVTAAYVKVSGTWKAMFNSGIEFLSTAAGFGDGLGGTSSGIPGSGGGGCFVAGTPITMADGTTKPVELVDLRDEVAVGGYVFATGKFLIDNLYEYKGIKVSGLHMVKEDGRWMRVMDSEHAVSLGDDEHVVYVFGSEYRRIVINGIEFTDYFEISEKEELLNHGDKFFGIWQDHDRQIHEKNVKILNDGK